MAARIRASRCSKRRSTGAIRDITFGQLASTLLTSCPNYFLAAISPPTRWPSDGVGHDVLEPDILHRLRLGTKARAAREQSAEEQQLNCEAARARGEERVRRG
mmetsp:Transcript_58542/g.127158  ORF Transcript_58542/g.127158 Transcript_58542/m.127158 type:complete len:103 (-) Transcript_58542:259-567(-)